MILDKLHILATLLLLAANSVDARELERDGVNNQNSSSEEKTVPVIRKVPDSNRQKSEQPSTNFTPSEKITADSAVSFPVDI